MIDHLLKDCLYFTVSHLSRTIDRMALDAFLPTGLSPTYAFVLMLTTEKPGISQKELCVALNLKPSTVSRFIDKLEAQKLVTRVAEGKNSLIYLTDAGHALQPEIMKAWERLYHSYSKDLGYEAGDELTDIIYKAARKLDHY